MKSYLKHKILNLIDIKELTAVEYLDFEGKYRNYAEKHDFWELCCSCTGKTEVTVEGKHKTLEGNKLFLIPPDKEHSYYSEEGNKSKVFVVCFQCFSQALRPLSETEFDLRAEYRWYMEKIIEESPATFRMNEEELLEVVPAPVIGGQQMIILLLECLLINLLRNLSINENSGIVFLDSDGFYRNLTETVISFLGDNIGKKLSLDEICVKFNYSRSFLCKIFKLQTGDTIISCFNKMKVEEAKKRLIKSNMKINEISCSLGFQEVKYFDYIFKKYTGVSPAVFREENVREE